MGILARLLKVFAAALAVSAMASANAATIPLRAWLNGAQVPLAIGGTGLGTVSFDTVTKVLTWSVTYSGLSGACTASHFHGPASAGVNASPVVGMTCSASPLTGSSTALTPTEEAQLLSGQWYINIHTGANPNGEIRGQVLPVRGDLNGDGRSDVLWRNTSTGENYLYPMNETTILAGEGFLRTVADLNWKIAGVGDFDGDGKADILWRNSATGEDYIYLMNGTAVAGEGFLPTVADQSWQVAGVGDFDGDGKADIVWRNSATGENYMYFMNGATVRAEGFVRQVADPSWKIAGVGDFDGDGKADIVWRNSATGENYMYFMNGATVRAEGFVRQVADPSWKIAGVGDFDGDGKADIVWRSSATGENYMYFMNGATVRAEGFVRQVADPNWKIAAVGDYNGDGRADIFWRNGATGENYIYPMGGLTILAGEGYLRTVADLAWNPIGGGGGGGTNTAMLFQTTFDIPAAIQPFPVADHSDAGLPPDGDGINWQGDWFAQPGNVQDEISAAANMSAGGGGKGFRHAVGDGASNNGGGIVISWSAASEIWLRYYIRFPLGFAWGGETNMKTIYFLPPGVFYFGLHDGAIGGYIQEDGRVHKSTVTWADMQGGSTGDGLWHCLEVHAKMNSLAALSDGVFEFWLDGTKIYSHSAVKFESADGQQFSSTRFGENAHDPGNGGVVFVDFDDIAVSATGYIGP